MHHLTVRSKMMLAFGSLAIVMLLLVGASVSLLSAANARFDSYVSGVTARAQLAAKVRAAVDLRAIAARNLVLVTTPDDVALEKASVTKAQRDATTALAQLNQLAQAPGVSAEVRQMIDAIDQVEKLYAPVAMNIVELALAGQHEDAIRKMNEECRPLLARLITASDAYAEFTAQQADQQVKAARQAYERQRDMLLLGCALAVVLAGIAGILIERSLAHDMGAEPADLRSLVGRVADGDLTSPINVRAGDEMSVLAAVSRMQTSLTHIVSTVRQEAEEVSAASEQISDGNAELASRSESQASALEQTAASMEEFSATVRQNADNAHQANQMAQSASTTAAHGGVVVGQVVDTMQGINDSSRKIADIIGVIDGIAFQTNILALNAAVEAARAGEQGRGFAVVASEVRSLAGRSSDAAKEIKVLIDDSVARVGQGAALVADAGKTMEDIVAGIRGVAHTIGAITVASQEQSTGVAQVGESISHMDQSTQQNAAMVEEMAATARNLYDKAHLLVKTMAVFKVNNRAPGLPR